MYIMVVANLFTFAWFSHHQESQPGNEYAQDYAATDEVNTIRLLSELDPIIGVTARTQLQSQAEGICHTIGPFKDHEEAGAALERMKKLGKEGAIRSGPANVKTGYWVYLEQMPVQEIEGVIQELKKNGIEDYHNNERNELSLGIYNKLHVAERRQKSIAALGFSPLVGPLYRNMTRYWIDVADMEIDILTDEAWDSYLDRYSDSQLQSMKCDVINA